MCEGTICHEIIKPFFEITSVSENNSVTVSFDEMVMSQTALEDNLDVNIKGPLGVYKY